MPNTEECMELIPKLAKKPSDLIRQAIHDLERAEIDPRYSVKMSFWHQELHGCCAVCIAGAVMAFSLDASLYSRMSPSSYSHNYIWSRLHALDDFRSGHIRMGLVMMDLAVIGEDSIPEYYKVTAYEQNPMLFKADMRSMADALEANGY